MINKILIFVVLIFFSIQANALQVIEVKHKQGDNTLALREIFENISDKEVKLVFEKGVYEFRPDYAFEKYCYITNHNNGLKSIIFPFENFTSVEIEGNGAEFVFHGQVMPFLFSNCKKVSVTNLTIDWAIPFTFQGEFIQANAEEGWYDLKPFNEGFSWKIENGQLKFPNINGFNFSKSGSTLEFEQNPKKVAHGVHDYYTKPIKVEKLENGNLRFYEKLRHYPEKGNVLHMKGPMNENRYAPAFQVISSSNISFDKVNIHHALGMGFLFERSSDISIINSGIFVKKDSKRVVSIIADATHFCNCKGDILVQNCLFENMLDDGTNVHGTYVEIEEVIDSKTIRFKLKHFQQTGFEFAGEGDKLCFVNYTDFERKFENEVISVKKINSRYSEIKFKNELSQNIKKGDLIENLTWNPTFTMRNCTIQNHRARGIVLKTPKKILIEKNYFSSMMAAILFRAEGFFWFESGAVNDVVIRENEFKNCVYSGSQQAVLYVTPRFSRKLTFTKIIDKNIRFENNKINTFGNRIVWAYRVENLTIKNNEIVQNNSLPQLFPNAPVFDLKNCKNVNLIKNTYSSAQSKNKENIINADETTLKTLTRKGNKGF